MASITLNYTAQQTALLSAAIGWELGLGRDATLAEAKQWLNGITRSLAERYERVEASRTKVVTPMDAT